MEKYDKEKLKEFLDDASRTVADYVIYYDLCLENEGGDATYIGKAIDAYNSMTENVDEFLEHPKRFQREIAVFGQVPESFLL